ncbi:MAG: hypothetical protein WC717_03640 [Candidatus Micrarchaeia archaeon]|jgi:hypothetical protein
MEIDWSDESKADMKAFERKLQGFFLSHSEKLARMPPRRHMQHWLPWNVEDVTKQARLVYLADGDILRVIRCFATHKEYERWYQSYR